MDTPFGGDNFTSVVSCWEEFSDSSTLLLLLESLEAPFDNTLKFWLHELLTLESGILLLFEDISSLSSSPVFKIVMIP